MAIEWNALRQRIQPQRDTEETADFDAVQAAQREIEAARALFREASDDDLVDHAIYRLHAAERHFIFLLRQVREHREASVGKEGRIGSIRG